MTGAPVPPRLPLEGIRVVEYAQYVAGPFAGMLLADLGADVVKVEPPTGDAWRAYEPFAAGESRYFYALNRNKRSVVLDLKRDEGLRASRALIRTAGAGGQPCRSVVLCLGTGQRRSRRVADRL
jgi:crotonobetainyl-CoA:carnitine CoA-transferase CaiB-like acyl-CoA transferase